MYAAESLTVFKPEEVNGELRPTQFKVLWDRLDYTETYGRSVNDWRNDKRPKDWE